MARPPQIPSEPAQLPLSVELLQIITAFSSTSQALFATISHPPTASTSTSTSNQKATDLLATLYALDTRLSDLMRLVPQHTANQARIELLLKRIKERDALWRTDISEAESQRKALEGFIKKGRVSKARIDQEEAGQP